MLTLLGLVSALLSLIALILTGFLRSLFLGVLLLPFIRLNWSRCMIIVASVNPLSSRNQDTFDLGIWSVTSLDVKSGRIELLLLITLQPLLILLISTLLRRVFDVTWPRNSTSLLHFFNNGYLVAIDCCSAFVPLLFLLCAPLTLILLRLLLIW